LEGLGEVHETDDCALEALLKLTVRNSTLLIKGPMGLREGEHVRIDSRAQVLEWKRKLSRWGRYARRRG
jgi:hypothetical protein